MTTRRNIMIAATVGLVWLTGGCRNGSLEGREPDRDSSVASIPSPFVEREFWLALSSEPGWHLNEARSHLLAGSSREAAEELEKVAAILNFETRHSHSERERGLLLGSVSELREVSRQLRLGTDPARGGPSLAELDRVSALAFRTIAAHDATLGRDALEAGDARMAGRYIGETVKAVESGFELSGIAPGNALVSDLEQARNTAMSLVNEGEGTREEGLVSLERLDNAVIELGNVLTDRRR